MKLVKDWKKAHKMLSVQAMGLALAIQTTWSTIPDNLQQSLPPWVVTTVTSGLLIFGILGRLMHQPGVSDESQ